MILSPSEMRALEQGAFADGVSPEALMNEAGARIAEAIQQFCPVPGECTAVFGKGHNGGDALVAARHLASAGWTVHLVPAFPRDQWATLTRKKFEEAGLAHHHAPGRLPVMQGRPSIILDGLLGTGASGALREPIWGLCAQINRIRQQCPTQVFALDLPTGLDGGTGEASEDAVVADFTLTVGMAKTGLLADSATPFVGRLAVMPLRELSARAAVDAARGTVATPAALQLPRRRFDSHKGDYGRVGIVAGSRGFSGAAVLCANACVRAGAGLVTLYVPEEIYPIVASAVIPEVMVHPVAHYRDLLETRRDVLALGPGLGQERREEVLELIRHCQQPMIVDADGLNILAHSPEILRDCAGPRLLTPHPGEMARLAPESAGRLRREIVEQWTGRYPGTLLLKGARTVIAEPGRPLSYNTTGNPGMGSGGMGDTLTGVCAALAGQGLPLYDCARLGAWLCGHAAELALTQGGESEESLTATRLVEFLGLAFRDLRAEVF